MTWDKTTLRRHAETGVVSRRRASGTSPRARPSAASTCSTCCRTRSRRRRRCEVRYLLRTGAPLIKTYSLPANSRFNIWVNVEEFNGPRRWPRRLSAGHGHRRRSHHRRARDVSRPAGPLFDAGHESAGVTEPATEWFLAEGNAGDFFDLFVLIAQHDRHAALVQADFIFCHTGTIYTEAVHGEPPTRRFNIWVDEEDARGYAVRPAGVDAHPFAQRRAAHRRARDVVAGRPQHLVRGAQLAGRDATGTRWALAEGEVGGPRDRDVRPDRQHVAATRHGQGDAAVRGRHGPVERTFPVAANSRFNVDVRRSFPERSKSGSARSSRVSALRRRRSSSSGRCTGMPQGSLGRLAPTRSA